VLRLLIPLLLRLLLLLRVRRQCGVDAAVADEVRVRCVVAEVVRCDEG